MHTTQVHWPQLSCRGSSLRSDPWEQINGGEGNFMCHDKNHNGRWRRQASWSCQVQIFSPAMTIFPLPLWAIPSHSNDSGFIHEYLLSIDLLPSRVSSVRNHSLSHMIQHEWMIHQLISLIPFDSLWFLLTWSCGREIDSPCCKFSFILQSWANLTFNFQLSIEFTYHNYIAKPFKLAL